MTLVDVNVWVDYPLPAYEAWAGEPFVQALVRYQITTAWVGSFAALLAEDPTGPSEELIEFCAGEHPVSLHPAPTVNPLLPGWRETLQRWRREGVRIVRVYPPAQRYNVDADIFRRLCDECHRLGVVLQLVCSIEDPRTQPAWVRWPVLDLQRLPASNCPIVVTSYPLRRHDVFQRHRNLVIDLAMQEGTGAVRRLVDRLGASRVVFGSYTPVFYTASALLKLEESELTEAEQTAVTHLNAQQLLENPP